jgi:hypothetical protein
MMLGIKGDPMDDIEKLITRKMFEIMGEQKPGDVKELYRLAAQAKQRGYINIAKLAEETADQFEQEDLIIRIYDRRE